MARFSVVLVATYLFVVATTIYSDASSFKVLAGKKKAASVTASTSSTNFTNSTFKATDVCGEWQKWWDEKYHQDEHDIENRSEHILYGKQLPTPHIISLGFFPLLLVAVFLGSVIHYCDLALPAGCFRLPFTVSMGIMGVVIAFAWWLTRHIRYPKSDDFLAPPTHYSDAILHESRMSVCEWMLLPSDGIMFVLLPPLLFESAFSIKWHTFARVLPASALLAGPGVTIAIACTAVLVQCVNQYLLTAWGWGSDEWLYSFMLACMLSATDPVAVVGVLHTVGAPDKLAVLIEGESLLNDGSAMLLFSLFKKLIEDTFPRTIALDLVILLVAAPIIGLIMANLLIFFMKQTEEPMLECSLLVISVYALFYIAEHLVGTSGILAEVAFGIYMARLVFLSKCKTAVTYVCLLM